MVGQSREVHLPKKDQRSFPSFRVWFGHTRRDRGGREGGGGSSEAFPRAAGSHRYQRWSASSADSAPGLWMEKADRARIRVGAQSASTGWPRCATACGEVTRKRLLRAVWLKLSLVKTDVPESHPSSLTSMVSSPPSLPSTSHPAGVHVAEGRPPLARGVEWVVALVVIFRCFPRSEHGGFPASASTPSPLDGKRP